MEEIPSLNSKYAEIVKYIEKCYPLNSSEKKILLKRLWTFSSKVRQPRKDDRSCNKTPYFNRWDTDPRTSYLTSEDPRYATKQECENVFLKLLTQLLEAANIDLKVIEKGMELRIIEDILERKFKANNLKCIYSKEIISKEDIKDSLSYATQRLGSFEIPTGYLLGLDKGGKHRSNNIGWMKPFHVNYRLRQIFKEELLKAGGTSRSAKNALDKIQVKAYCTDKFTMPPFFSNRDIRWATWTNSNQYASHYDCCMIELELMCQIFEFNGAPELDSSLIKEMEKKRETEITRNSKHCYITGKDLSFKTYLEGAISPKGGKSVYHVSHVNPLTRGGRHFYRNVEWITEDGNRIQGNDTLQEIEIKLIDAVIYYLEKNVKFLPKIKEKLLKLRELISSKIGK